MSQKFRVGYDCALKRPACALLQVVFGAPSWMAYRFPVETWLVSPTENLFGYEVDEEELVKLVAITVKAHEEREKP